MSGRKVELDEVIVPSLKLESSTSEKNVPMIPTPTRDMVRSMMSLTDLPLSFGAML